MPRANIGANPGEGTVTYNFEWPVTPSCPVCGTVVEQAKGGHMEMTPEQALIMAVALVSSAYVARGNRATADYLRKLNATLKEFVR